MSNVPFCCQRKESLSVFIHIMCRHTHTLNSDMKGLISQNVPQACCAIVLKTIKLVGNSETMNWNTKRGKKTGA